MYNSLSGLVVINPLQILSTTTMGAFTIVPEVKMLILPLVTNLSIVSPRFYW